MSVFANITIFDGTLNLCSTGRALSGGGFFVGQANFSQWRCFLTSNSDHYPALVRMRLCESLSNVHYFFSILEHNAFAALFKDMITNITYYVKVKPTAPPKIT